MRITAGTVATALVMFGLLAARAQGAGWVGPIALPGVTGTSQTIAVTRSGWLGAAVPGATAGTEQVLIRDPGGTWTPSTITGVGTLPNVTLGLSERGDAVLGVGNGEHQVLVFGHAAGTSGFVPMGTVLPSGYMYGPLDVLALENGTAAVMASTATDLFLATGPVGGALSSQSVLPASTNTPKSASLVSNPRGDALLVFADHSGTTERVDGLRRAPGGAFVPFAAPLDTLAGGVVGSSVVLRPTLDDAGATEVMWIGDTTGPIQHLRAGHLPAGATALTTPTGGRAVRTTVAGQQVQGPEIGAVPLPGDSGAGLYTLFTPPSTVTTYDISHAGAAGAYGAGTAVASLPAIGFGLMPEPGSAGGLAVPALGGSTLTAFERHTDSTYVAGAAVDITGWSSLSAGRTDGADTAFAISLNGPKVAIFDDAPPVLGAPGGPATAVAGAPAALTVAAGDASGPPSIGWTFGDGGTATGGAVYHTWSSPGTYTIGVTATDAVGQRSTQSRQIVVAPAPAVDKTPPTLTHVKLSPSKVRRHKARTKLKLTLSEAAKVTVTVTAKVTGHRSGKKCRAGFKRHAKRCTATKTELTVHKTLAAGAGSITLKLRRSVPTGTLTVKVSATDAAGNKSKTTTLKLRVRR